MPPIPIHQIIRSRRRSLALIIDHAARLIVRAPLRLREEEIIRLVSQRSHWVERKVREISSRPRQTLIPQHEANEWKKVARQKIEARCRIFSGITGLWPKAIRISNARTRWGSCSTSGRVSFSWRLALFPDEIIDYVVVHELVHLAEPNHSRYFWEKVERVMPDHRAHRRWLREKGSFLAPVAAS